MIEELGSEALLSPGTFRVVFIKYLLRVNQNMERGVKDYIAMFC